MALPPDATHQDSLRALYLDAERYPSLENAMAAVFRVRSVHQFPESSMPVCDADILESPFFWRVAVTIDLELVRPVHGEPPRELRVFHVGATELHDVDWSDSGHQPLTTGDLVIGETYPWVVYPDDTLLTLHRVRVFDFGPEAAIADTAFVSGIEALYGEYYTTLRQ